MTGGRHPWHERHGDRWQRRHGWHGGHAPPWWPEGEPFRPPWQSGRRFRRRFVGAALVFVAFIVGLGMLFGLLFGGRDGGKPERDRPGPFPLIGFVVTATVATGLATTFAYRRLSRPVGELLDAAEQVASGDFDVDVVPEGPRELRTLTTAFNDMAGRLASAEDQRRRFLADVSHELRTPLAVLQSGIEAQLDGVHPRDDQHLASLLDEAHRLGRLVDDLHTLALAEAGRIVLHREPVDAAGLAEEAVAGHRALADRNGVTLRVATPASPGTAGRTDRPEPARRADGRPASPGTGGRTDRSESAPLSVDADPTRIRQVLDNLLANALRYTPAGGEVRLTVEPSDRGGVRFTVTDTGPGFPPDQLGQVFDRFVRAADSQGSGLGLSIARDLVEAHGGTITATNLPTGAAVSFVLPPR